MHARTTVAHEQPSSCQPESLGSAPPAVVSVAARASDAQRRRAPQERKPARLPSILLATITAVAVLVVGETVAPPVEAFRWPSDTPVVAPSLQQLGVALVGLLLLAAYQSYAAARSRDR